MNTRYVILLILLIISKGVFPQKYNNKIPGLYAVRYVLDLRHDYSDEKLNGSCELTLTNPSGKPCREIPLLLYRLLNIKSIKDKSGHPLEFIQHIVSYEDWEQLQANFIIVSIKTPIPEGGI